MSINRTVVKTWIATVILHNGQTIEVELRGNTIKQCRELLKQDTQVKTVAKFRQDVM